MFNQNLVLEDPIGQLQLHDCKLGAESGIRGAKFFLANQTLQSVHNPALHCTFGQKQGAEGHK